jgi:hypothetical protein
VIEEYDTLCVLIGSKGRWTGGLRPFVSLKIVIRILSSCSFRLTYHNHTGVMSSEWTSYHRLDTKSFCLDSFEHLNVPISFLLESIVNGTKEDNSVGFLLAKESSTPQRSRYDRMSHPI